MACKVTVIRDGHSVAAVYPRSGFGQIFCMLDGSDKWERNTIDIALSLQDQEGLAADIASALNNIENLDLA